MNAKLTSLMLTLAVGLALPAAAQDAASPPADAAQPGAPAAAEPAQPAPAAVAPAGEPTDAEDDATADLGPPGAPPAGKGQIVFFRASAMGALLGCGVRENDAVISKLPARR